jgi:hypothetical protein
LPLLVFAITRSLLVRLASDLSEDRHVQLKCGVELCLGRQHLASVGFVRELVEVIAAPSQLSQHRFMVDVARGLGYGAEGGFADEAGDRETARLGAFGYGRNLGWGPADELGDGAEF